MIAKGISKSQAEEEFSQSCERIIYYASMADKFEGNIHNPPMRGLTLAVKESIGIVASIMSDDSTIIEEASRSLGSAVGFSRIGSTG